MSRRKLPEHLSTLRKVADSVTCSRVMFVDSGSGGTGWAAFYIPAVNRHPDPIKPYASDGITSRAKTWAMRMAQIAEDLPLACARNKVDYVVIEWPEIWAGSDKSYAAAASGKLLQLAAACGALIQGVHLMRRAVGVMLITPREWKGQLSKAAVNERIWRALRERYPNHVSDAVGMGLAAQGML